MGWGGVGGEIGLRGMYKDENVEMSDVLFVKCV